MNPMPFVLACASFIFCSSLQAPPSAASKTSPPNVILILVDDLGWTDLSCQGSRFYETPGECPFIGQQFSGAYMRGIVAAAEATPLPRTHPLMSPLTGDSMGSLRS